MSDAEWYAWLERWRSECDRILARLHAILDRAEYECTRVR